MAVVALVAPAWGQQVITEDLKLLPSDGAAADLFGYAIAIDNGIIAVGAQQDDDNGSSSGSAYLFDASTGAQVAKLLPKDGAAYDWFGWSVAIDNGVVAVGALLDDDNGAGSGSAYLFDTTGAQFVKLLPSDGAAGDQFGISISIDNGVAAVGAHLDQGMGFQSGSAYLFNASTGAQIAKLLPGDGGAGDAFGRSIAINNGIVAVGAYLDDDNGNNSGSAYLFDASTGAQIAKLLPSDGASEDQFGISIAIDNGIVAVGARGDDGRSVDSGSVYLFDASTGAQIAKLLARDGAAGDQFGISVSIDAGVVAVGAYFDNDTGNNSGSAYLFDASTGTQIAKLLPSDGAADDQFGFSIAIDNGVVGVGTFQDDDNGTNSGAAQVYDIAILAISPDPLLAGQDGVFTVRFTNPNTNTFLAYTLVGLGSTYIAPLNITLDLDQPSQAGGMVTSDGTGTAQWVLPIPQAAAGRDVWFQACQFESKSNVVSTRIQ
ncbi:MAG: hypothetical protein HND57_14265 [Planctomycetes bacterium]|nr:hypothetical protein [Planctomycetota bacterium]